MAKFFIIASFKKGALYTQLRDILEAEGHTLSHDWYQFCCQQKQVDPRIVQSNTSKDVQGIKDADIVVLLTPCGNDSFVELGAAIAFHKPVFVAVDLHGTCPDCSYFNAPSVHSGPYTDAQSIYNSLTCVMQHHIARIRHD